PQDITLEEYTLKEISLQVNKYLRRVLTGACAVQAANPLCQAAFRVFCSTCASNVLASYVEAGDEILVPDPGYPGYRHFVRAFEGAARTLPVSAAGNFQSALEMVRAAGGPRTQGLLLGSPSN